jgi:hypothetical protein
MMLLQQQLHMRHPGSVHLLCCLLQLRLMLAAQQTKNSSSSEMGCDGWLCSLQRVSH